MYTNITDLRYVDINRRFECGGRGRVTLKQVGLADGDIYTPSPYFTPQLRF
jgi:hypothetical protein